MPDQGVKPGVGLGLEPFEGPNSAESFGDVEMGPDVIEPRSDIIEGLPGYIQP